MFRLETERLIIRGWEAADRPALAAMAQDPVVVEFVHGGVPFTEEEVDGMLARQAKQLADFDLCMGALVEKTSNRVVGVTGIQPLGTTGELEIGWWLARDVWGRGYATEAGGAAMRHVLETLGHPRVLAIIDPANERSKAVVRRLGFHYDSRVTGAQLGHRMPEIVVDLFARERG
ncbi:MAG: GNAT family N-acetyltransferase [Acidobacteriota bacterium]|nr:GNAT family N-acetyltransferase [Acidobacteriota bacterium]